MNFKQYILEQQDEDVIVVTNQNEWFNLDKTINKTVHIKAVEHMFIRDIGNLKIIVKETPDCDINVFDNVFIIAENKSVIAVYSNGTVFAKDSVKVNAFDNSKVFAEDDVHVMARDNSYVEASDNVFVEAFNYSKVIANDNVEVLKYNRSDITLNDNAKIVGGWVHRR